MRQGQLIFRLLHALRREREEYASLVYWEMSSQWPYSREAWERTNPDSMEPIYSKV